MSLKIPMMRRSWNGHYDQEHREIYSLPYMKALSLFPNWTKIKSMEKISKLTVDDNWRQFSWDNQLFGNEEYMLKNFLNYNCFQHITEEIKDIVEEVLKREIEKSQIQIFSVCFQDYEIKQKHGISIGMIDIEYFIEGVDVKFHLTVENILADKKKDSEIYDFFRNLFTFERQRQLIHTITEDLAL